MVWRNRMVCSWVVGFELSIDRAASRHRRARRYFPANSFQDIVFDTGCSGVLTSSDENLETCVLGLDVF